MRTTFSALSGTTLWLALNVATPALTAEETCRDGEFFDVCVSWDTGTPIHLTHFEVTFNGSAPPNVSLLTARDDWKVRVTNASRTAPADLASLSTSDSGNFTVVLIGSGGAAGAVNVGTVDLTPSGNYGSLIDSHISGNLTGQLSLQATSGGTGGELRLTVGGNVSGGILVHTLKALTIGNNLTGNVYADVIDGSMTV